MSEIFAHIFIIIVASIFMIIIPVNFNHYEYIDIDGNNGVASKCSYTDKGIYSGGQGSPICKLNDGTVLSVKQYKQVYEGKCSLWQVQWNNCKYNKKA